MKKQSAVPPVWLCWFTCLGGLAAYFWAQGDQVTSAVVGLVAVTGLAGYSLGAAVVVAFLATLSLSSLFAARLANLFGPTVSEVVGTTGILNQILATCIGCITLGFVAMLLVEIVWNRMLGKRGHLRAFNHSLGLSLGAIQGAFLTLVLLGGVLVAEPYARFEVRQETENVRDFVGKCAADAIVKVGQASRRSPLGPFIKQFNPFECMPQLRELRENQHERVAAIR